LDDLALEGSWPGGPSDLPPHDDGGGNRDQWNDRLLFVTRALPVDQYNADAVSRAGSAVAAGTVDMNPADPIEGILIAQLVVANEAALSMYRRAWACPPDHYFEAHTKYLRLADKASRTVAMLTERLDQHRGRGHQQIIVKHVTVNADQAMVAESIVAGNVPRKETSLLAATVLIARCRSSNRPRRKLCRVGEVRSQNEHQPHAKHTEGSRGPSMQSKVKADRAAVQGACSARFSRVPDAWRSWRSA
jgi:hypothetical protein